MSINFFIGEAGAEYAKFKIWMKEKNTATVALSTEAPLVKDGFTPGSKRPPLFPAGLEHLLTATAVKDGNVWFAEVTFEKKLEKDKNGNPTKKVIMKSLKPGTKYHYVVSWGSKDSKKKGFWFKTGVLDTQWKVAFIDLESIHVSNDSDPWASGELQFAFFASDQFLGAWPLSGQAGVTDGQTLTFPPYSMVFNKPKAGKSLKLIAIGRDDDTSATGLNKLYWPPGPDAPTEGTSNYEMTRGTTLLKLVGNEDKPKQPEHIKDKFSIVAQGGNGSDLEFECYGSYEIKEFTTMDIVHNP